MSDTNGKCLKLRNNRKYRFHIVPKGARPTEELSPIDGTTYYTAEQLAVKYPPYIAASVGRQMIFNQNLNSHENYDPNYLCDDARYSRGPKIGTTEKHYRPITVKKTVFKTLEMYKLYEINTLEMPNSYLTPKEKIIYYMKNNDKFDYSSYVANGQYFQDKREYQVNDIIRTGTNPDLWNITFLQLPKDGVFEPKDYIVQFINQDFDLFQKPDTSKTKSKGLNNWGNEKTIILPW